MAERANEPLPRRREASSMTKLLSPELAAELRPPVERPAPAETGRRSAAEMAFKLLAMLEPLPSDYYFG